MNPFVGEIRMFPYAFVPTGWFPCDGRSLPVQQFTPLYTVIGYQFGGGGSNFSLPNLVVPTSNPSLGYVPMGVGEGPGLTNRPFAAKVGEVGVTLTLEEFPVHNHTAMAANKVGGQLGPPGHTWANGVGGSHATHIYVPANDPTQSVTLAPDTIAPFPEDKWGGPHNNVQPYIQMQYCIAYEGTFPPRLGGEEVAAE